MTDAIQPTAPLADTPPAADTPPVAEVIRHYQRMIQRVQTDHRVPALQVALHRADRPCGPTRSACRVPNGSSTRTPSSGSARSPRRSPRCWSCSAATTGCSTSTTRSARTSTCRRHGDLTIRRLLSHTSGIQREPHGDVWDTLDAPDRRRAAGRSRPYRAGAANRRAGSTTRTSASACSGTWSPSAARRYLGRGARPTGSCARCGLDSITVAPDRAGGDRVHWSTRTPTTPSPEPATDTGAIAPAGAAVGYRRRPGPVGRVPGRPGDGRPRRRRPRTARRWRRCAGR